MEQLKRVFWKIGQALLPAHLAAQESSLLTHSLHYSTLHGLPLFGIKTLKWDEALVQKGVVSIQQLHVVFPSGEIVDVPNNASIASFDLSKGNKNRISLYLHLLKDSSEHEDFIDSCGAQESVLFAMHQLSFSTEQHLFNTKNSIKIGEFEKDVEGFWKIHEGYIPPLISVISTPFLSTSLNQLTSLLKNLQSELELESTTGEQFATRTVETRLALWEIRKIKRYLDNLKKGILTHPYYLYDRISQLLDTLALIYADKGNIPAISYEHEQLSLTFPNLLNSITNYLSDSSDKMRRLQFTKKEDCYLSEELPLAIQNAKEIYLIIQPLDAKLKPQIEGLKLAAYSRLSVICQFALTGIELLRLETAPFNNNFSKLAHIYSVKKGAEWNFTINEKRMALTVNDDGSEHQVYLYWNFEE